MRLHLGLLACIPAGDQFRPRFTVPAMRELPQRCEMRVRLLTCDVSSTGAPRTFSHCQPMAAQTKSPGGISGASPIRGERWGARRCG
jgi:hypothetical protein